MPTKTKTKANTKTNTNASKSKKAPSSTKTRGKKASTTRDKKAPNVTPQMKPGDPRLEKILTLLQQTYPRPATALDHQTPLQLLVATILSAQCTDERVNKVTPALFAAFPAARDLAQAPTERLEELIHSTGFFRAKARSIQGASRILHEKYAGEVPAEMDLLLELPGVARKTANVVLGSAFGLSVGVVVDTHVKRLSARLGFTEQTDPNKVEKDLMALLPRERWIAFSHQLILHGRATCVARKPRCNECVLSPYCPSAEKS